MELISSNPAVEAYRKAMETYALQDQRQVTNERLMREEAEARRTQGSRLAGVTADSTVRQNQATISTQTMADKIAQEQARTTQAGLQTQRDTISTDIAAQTKDLEVQGARDRSRLSTLSVDAAENKALYEVLELAERGETAAAKQVAAQYGKQIPDEFLMNRQIMGTLNRAAKQAQQLYPTNPQKQAQHMEIVLRTIGSQVNALPAPVEQRMSANPPQDQTFLGTPGNEFMRVPGMPEPETSTAKGRRPLLFEVKRDAALALGMSPDEAMRFAAGQKVLSDQELRVMASRIMAHEMPSSAWGITPEQREARAQEIMLELRALPNAGMPPAQPQAPAAPGAVPGLGTQDDPYIGNQQSHVDWFRQNAPEGSVISINGKLYTK